MGHGDPSEIGYRGIKSILTDGRKLDQRFLAITDNDEGSSEDRRNQLMRSEDQPKSARTFRPFARCDTSTPGNVSQSPTGATATLRQPF